MRTQQKQKPAPRKTEEVPPPQEHAEAADTSVTDELLDEIDALLEEQGIDTEQEAADFVRSYQQKGGQ